MTETTRQAGPAVKEQLDSGALSGSWVLDPSASTLGLKTKAMWGMVPVKGTFGQLSGTATVTPDGTVSAKIDVPSASINTKSKKRDTHLRSDDFFASDAYPNITFEVDSVDPSTPQVLVNGRLTVRDRTAPLSFPATVTMTSSGVIDLDAVVEVDRKDVGIDFAKMGATKMINIVAVHAVFKRS